MIESFQEAASHPVGNLVLPPLPVPGESLAGPGSHRVLRGCERLQRDPGEGGLVVPECLAKLGQGHTPLNPLLKAPQGVFLSFRCLSEVTS